MKSSMFWIGALTVLVAGASPVAAQEEPGPQVFGEVIDVRVVNVETVVTDEKGNVARGLKPEDFRLLVDGKEVPVEYFSEIVEGEAAATGDGEAVSAQVGKGEEVGRRYLVLIDDSFSVPSTRDELLTRIARDLGAMKPGDEMAVLAFDGAEIDVLCPWSSDRALVTAALSGAKKRPAHGHQFLAQHRSMGEDMDTALEAAIALELDQGEIAALMATLNSRVSPETRGRLGKTAQAATGALRGFEAPPGRKVLLFLTAGWAMSVAPHLYGPMIDDANRLGYTVYPVDAASSDTRGMKVLDVLATRTGGKVASTAKMVVLRQVAADTSSYYWLGFTPAWKADESRHKVEIEVRRAGFKTRSRAGFSDLSRQAEAKMKAESALLFGAPEEEKRLIVQLGEPKKAGRRQIEVPVTVGVPVSSLALTPEGDGYIAEAPLAVAALDSKGGRSELPTSKLRVRVKVLPQGGGYARFQTVVKLRDTEQRLVFTVHDPVNGTVLWGEATVHPRVAAKVR
ncbi:MAG TPA: VWA domain-containing protein [Thermoanaerobaculia bacterium]|nr:VWA domain-containing protein [Thermoanaerobaculia bacterium]